MLKTCNITKNPLVPLKKTTDFFPKSYLFHNLNRLVSILYVLRGSFQSQHAEHFFGKESGTLPAHVRFRTVPLHSRTACGTVHDKCLHRRRQLLAAFAAAGVLFVLF